MTRKKQIAAAAALTAAFAGNAMAVDLAGFEFNGYSRGGPVLSYTDGVKGNLALGGELQKYRLGNEGDNGIEVNLARTFDLNGMKFKVDYMPAKWNSGSVNTEQAYVEVSGFSFSPEAKFWVGQRRLRIQDVHIVDYFLMNYGDNQGGGVTDIPIGGAKLGLGVFSGDKFDAQLPTGVKATRLNADISEIKTNPGGILRVLFTGVHGSGLANSNTGAGLSVSHNQADFLMPGMSNALFLQTSRGHARIDGEFEAIDGVTPGRKVNRIADSIAWQRGPFGGQALVAYQSNRDDATGATTKDFSLGGRISYALTKNFKMLVEAATTTRKPTSGADQRLSKFTIAPTLALNEDFWSRPELRFYVTTAHWNAAAAAANATTFGQGGKTSRSIAGIQYEIWW
jgi:maltoporin